MRTVYVRSVTEARWIGAFALRPRRLNRVTVLRCCRRRSLQAAASQACPASPASLIAWKDDFNERFILERSIGRGSFGEVWLATDKVTRERVAVKEMPKRRGKLTKEGTLAKVDREVCVMENLKTCPAAVQLKECHALPNSYRIVMEYCSGLDLREQIKRYGPAPEEVVAFVAYEILHILKKCHANRIVHGDVKTANFILHSADVNPFASKEVNQLKPGWLKAIDFGCSQYIKNGARITTRVGTPVFMSPEVFDRDYSYESDLWSLGVVLYQLLSGRFPFWDSTQSALLSSVQDVMETVHDEDPDFANAPFNHVSADCLDFLQRLLDKNYLTRMNVKEALEHPFITCYVTSTEQEQAISVNNNIVPAATASLKAVPAMH